MGIPSTRFLKAIKGHAKGRRLTESVATLAISRWLYQGHGEKHLSLPVCEDGIGRPADANPRRFCCPDTAIKYARWLPFKDHVTGDLKGIIADEETKMVPFIAVDVDRHSAAISSQQHQKVVVKIGQHLRQIPHVKWIVEVNPHNGSAKFFGFRRTGDHFLLKDAQSLASRIRHELVELELCHNGNIEIFPDNSKAMFLPLRKDKLTIADKGILPRHDRKIKDVRFYGKTVWENLRCYSALHFLNWIYQGDNYDGKTLISALRYSCAGLLDEVAPAGEASVEVTEILKVRSSARNELANNVPTKPLLGAINYGNQEPCAFKRNWTVLLEFSRGFFRANNRLPTTTEALKHLKQNKFFSGQWTNNEAHRRQRVTDILVKISETFNPALLQSHDPVKLNPGIRHWCRRRFPNGFVSHRQRINELEMCIETQEIRVSARFVEHCVGVIAFCLNDHLENKALPVNRIKAIWNLVSNAPCWNQTYFQVVRNHLEKIGVIKIFDKNHQTGNAWKWEKGTNFPARMRDRQSGKKARKIETSLKDRPSTAGAREWKRIKKEKIHKSLYHTLPQQLEMFEWNECSRDPPFPISSKSQFFRSD